MRIQALQIDNYRGIKHCNIQFPEDSRMVFLLGAGDTTKSTILNAIQWLLWPSWNLIAVDTDFYKKDTNQCIQILGTFSEIPEELVSEEKFGLYLRKSNVDLDGESNDEPVDGQPICLSLKLTIDSSLEPKWNIVCNRKDPVSISNTDRKKMSCGVIGNNCSKDLIWGKNSILQKYADSKGVLHEAYMQTIREVAKNANFTALDKVAENVLDIGKNYGIGLSEEITNKLIYQNGSYTTNVGLFDGEVPLSQLGSGSQRLLSMGLNVGRTEEGAILLVDEIETGLEPYRLKSLINTLRNNCCTTGQVIATTHSPIAVAEAVLRELLFITNGDGETNAVRMEGDDSEINFFQGQVRGNAESFLTKRLIVCEGKTEVGFIRALDEYLQKNENWRMAYYGTSTFIGGGENVLRCAELLHNCGYEVCVLMDSDKETEEAKKSSLRNIGIQVFDWNKPYAIEQQIYAEATNEVAEKLISIAIKDKGVDSIKSMLSGNNGVKFVGDLPSLIDTITADQKVNIGKAAMNKNHPWYKRIDLGEAVGNVVFENYDSFPVDGRIRKVVSQIIAWVKRSDRTGSRTSIEC